MVAERAGRLEQKKLWLRSSAGSLKDAGNQLHIMSKHLLGVWENGSDHSMPVSQKVKLYQSPTKQSKCVRHTNTYMPLLAHLHLHSSRLPDDSSTWVIHQLPAAIEAHYNLPSGRTGRSLQMNRWSLRNNRLKLETAGELPMTLEESMEYTSKSI
jgi:hypothetical protein